MVSEVQVITKYLTTEGRFECGLDKLVEGKKYAFTAVITGDDEFPYGLGVAVENEPGYYPIPAHWAHSTEYERMCNHADVLNAQLGMTPRQSMKIIASSMKGSGKEWRRG
jgi:hypothetical protein